MPWSYAQDINGGVQEVNVVDEATGWSFYPLIANQEFRGVLGVNDQGSAVGNNVTIVLCEPDSNGHWGMSGWDAGVAIGSAVKWCRTEFDDPALFDSLLASVEEVTASNPVSMQSGLQQTDPAAPIIDYTQDPQLLDTLIAFGAAGSSGLSSSLLLTYTSGCTDGATTNLDATMSSIAVVARETVNPFMSPETQRSISKMGLSDINANTAICYPCFPWSYRFYGPWSPWACTGGPIPGTGNLCTYTGCTRSRSVTIVRVNIDCSGTVTPGTPDTQGPTTKLRPANADGSCPPSP